MLWTNNSKCTLLVNVSNVAVLYLLSSMLTRGVLNSLFFMNYTLICNEHFLYQNEVVYGYQKRLGI